MTEAERVWKRLKAEAAKTNGSHISEARARAIVRSIAKRECFEPLAPEVQEFFVRELLALIQGRSDEKRSRS